MLILQVLLLFVAGFSSLLVGILVLLQGNKKINNISFSALAISLAGWVFGIAGFLLTNDPGLAFMLAKVYYFFPLLIAISLVFFVCSFPDRLSVSKYWLLTVTTGFIALAVPLLLVNNFVTNGLVYHEWGKEIVLNKNHYSLYSFYLISCFSFGLTHIFFRAKQLERLHKAQASAFFKGFLVASFFGVLFNLIYPWFGNYHLIWLGPLFTILVVVTVAYSIVRHKMFDIRLVVARSLAYFSSLGLMLGLFALTSSLLTRLTFSDNANEKIAIIANTAMFITAILIYPVVKKFFDRVTNKFFYHDAYDPQSFLDKVNKTLVGNLDIGILLRHTATVIEQNIKADCYIYVKETDKTSSRIMGTTKMEFNDHKFDRIRKELATISAKTVVTDQLEEPYLELKKSLESSNIAVISSLITRYSTNKVTTAYLILGFKKSGNAYSSQDVRIIDIITDELLISIQNALRFEEIQSFNITLQNRINEATDKLKRSNAKLKELDKNKDEFISMASHQLRTPLTSVKGYLSMVLEGDAGKVSEQQQQLLNQAYASSQRMVYLIADLLNVSRLKTGKFIINATAINLADMVESEITQLKEAVKTHNLTLSFNKPANFPELMLDETKTRQVIMNFIDNAIYYTPAGGKIKVDLQTDRSSVYFTVKDNGLGVPKVEQSRMFTKFYRATNAQKARPDGTGLGLFMAKKVITDQGGTVLFESTENKGSTFGFKFSKPKA